MRIEPDPRELIHRYSGNPILEAGDFPKMVNAVFQSGRGCVEGRTLLLLRVESRSGLSSLGVAMSEDASFTSSSSRTPHTGAWRSRTGRKIRRDEIWSRRTWPRLLNAMCRV